MAALRARQTAERKKPTTTSDSGCGFPHPETAQLFNVTRNTVSWLSSLQSPWQSSHQIQDLHSHSPYKGDFLPDLSLLYNAPLLWSASVCLRPGGSRQPCTPFLFTKLNHPCSSRNSAWICFSNSYPCKILSKFLLSHFTCGAQNSTWSTFRKKWAYCQDKSELPDGPSEHAFSWGQWGWVVWRPWLQPEQEPVWGWAGGPGKFSVFLPKSGELGTWRWRYVQESHKGYGRQAEVQLSSLLVILGPEIQEPLSAFTVVWGEGRTWGLAAFPSGKCPEALRGGSPHHSDPRELSEDLWWL